MDEPGNTDDSGWSSRNAQPAPMNGATTILFADLVGSSAAYEAYGNDAAAKLVAQITQWAGRVCGGYHASGVKFLGDGVLAQFPLALSAAGAAMYLQQHHAEQVAEHPVGLQMGMKIGLATGETVQLNSDTYGDPVNLASRLCDLAGARAIWCDQGTMQALQDERSPLPEAPRWNLLPMLSRDAINVRSLGVVQVQGFEQAHSVFQLFWDRQLQPADLTQPATIENLRQPGRDPATATISLGWHGQSMVFDALRPIIIGRGAGSDFVVEDQRVSRHHVRIQWVGAGFELTDLSSYGTWVRFGDDQHSTIPLRRDACQLYGAGELSLSSPFYDLDAPRVRFEVGEAWTAL